MDGNKSSSGRALIRTVAGNQLGDAIFDLAEVVLDKNLAEGLLKDVPIVGTLVKLARAGQSVSEELFLNKLQRFLANLNAVPIEDREKLIAQYPDSSDEQRILGENLLLAIERLDDIKKPAILARFFRAYIRSEVDYVTFTRLAHALEKFNIELLPNLSRFYVPEQPFVATSEEIIHELSLCGLVTAGLEGSGTIGGSAMYRRSELGMMFLSTGFDIQVR